MPPYYGSCPPKGSLASSVPPTRHVSPSAQIPQQPPVAFFVDAYGKHMPITRANASRIMQTAAAKKVDHSASDNRELDGLPFRLPDSIDAVVQSEMHRRAVPDDGSHLREYNAGKRPRQAPSIRYMGWSL